MKIPTLIKNIIFQLLLTLFCSLVFAVLLELYLRETVTHIRSVKNGSAIEANPELLISYTGKGRRLVPNASVIVENHYLSGLDVPIQTNHFGFRSPDFPAEKPTNEVRLLMLGDSITIGDYLPLEQNMSSLLEKKLNDLNSNKHYRVVNAGVMDIGLKEELYILEERGLAIAPDVVILNFYLNDDRPSWGFPSESRHANWLRRSSVLVETIYTQLKLNKLVSQSGTNRFAWVDAQNTLNWKESDNDFKKLIELAKYDWGSSWETNAWLDLKPLFNELRVLSEKSHFKVLLVAFPVKYQVYTQVDDPRINYPQEQLKAIAKIFDFQYLDLLPELRKNNSSTLFYDQCHPTSLGYNIIANSLFGNFENKFN